MMDCKKALERGERRLRARGRDPARARHRQGRQARRPRRLRGSRDRGRLARTAAPARWSSSTARPTSSPRPTTSPRWPTRSRAPSASRRRASVDALLDLSVERREAARHASPRAVTKLGEDLVVRRHRAPRGAGASGFVASLRPRGRQDRHARRGRGPTARPSRRCARSRTTSACTSRPPARRACRATTCRRRVVDAERQRAHRAGRERGQAANIVEKMIEGRLTKFFKEVVLLEQGLVMDPDKTVGKAAQEVGAKDRRLPALPARGSRRGMTAGLQARPAQDLRPEPRRRARLGHRLEDDPDDGARDLRARRDWASSSAWSAAAATSSAASPRRPRASTAPRPTTWACSAA